MSGLLAAQIRPICAGPDGDTTAAFGLTRFPNGLYAVLRLDLNAEGAPGELEWAPCCHAMHEETVRDGIERWTGISVPLRWVRGDERAGAA